MMNIRTADRSEVEKFQLYSSDNAGEEFIVVEQNAEIVGYAQFNSGREDAQIFFMESNATGAGRAMIEWFQSEFVEVGAMNAVETARSFYAKFGFNDVRSNGWAGQVDMFWYAEE
ncbi:MAG: GNAT family N-acetyltransferase [Rhizobiales bacterium]|nr:GNAT family N-acetyltransferase [Hyphomicrobiales bacterium]